MVLPKTKVQKFVLYGLMLLLSACTQLDKKQVYPLKTHMAWPEKPAKPRLVYVGHFSNPEEFGISRGFFELVVDFFTGHEDQQLVRPMAVVATNEKEVYVADPGAKGVHYFNSSQNDYRLIRQKGDIPLPSPVGLAIGPDGHVLVTDSELGKVFQLSPNTGIATQFNVQFSLKQPTGIAYDKLRKRLYIADTDNHLINIYDEYGRRLSQIGKRGNGKLQFNFPTMLALDKKGDLFITDSLNFRIQRINAKGKYIGQIGKLGGSSGSLTRPKGVATDNLDHIYIIDSLFHALQIFDAKGRLLMHLGGQGHNPGEFWLPSGIFIGENNTIFIADSFNKRIQVFQYIGGGV